MHRVTQRLVGRLLLQLGACVMGMAPAWAAPTAPKLVVVVDPQADGAVVKQASAVEAALVERLALVPLADYLRAAKAVGARPRASYGTESAVAAGRAAGASHVLVFEPMQLRQVGRRRQSVTVAVSLVDTQSGENLLERRTTGRESNRAAQETVARLATDVIAATTAAPAALAQQQAPPAPAAVAPAAAGSRQVAAEPERRPAVAQAPATKPTALPPVAPAAEPAAAPALVAPPVAPAPAQVAPHVNEAVIVAAAPVERRRQAPYGVHFQLGSLLYQRVAVLSEGSIPQLRYGGSARAKAPLFARVNARLELQPVRFAGGRPRIWDGLLVFADADLGWARTSGTQGAKTGRNGSWQAGGGWRQPLWRSPKAVAVALKLGYSRYSFVVPPGVAFVSDGFAGLLAELALEVPFGTPHVGLFAQAGVLTALRGFGGLQKLGSKSTASLGGRAEVGLRFLVAGHLDFDVAFNWQRYRIAYDGSSNATSLPRSYNGVRFTDQTLGGSARVGMRF